MPSVASSAQTNSRSLHLRKILSEGFFICLKKGGEALMPTQAKTEKIAQLKDKLDRATVTILVQTQGLKVKDMNDLRSKMRAAKVDIQVVKNALLRIASERNSMTLDRKLFDGQTTAVFGYDDEVAAA